MAQSHRARPGGVLHGNRMADFGQLFIWPGLLTDAWILTILETRVEKEN